MKRILFFGALALVLVLIPARGASALGVKDVIAMHRDGIADSLIIQKIRHSDAVFHLNSKDLRRLQQEGVSDHVVAAMLRTEDRHDYYYDPYWPGTRVIVGFDYGFGPPFGPWYGYWPFYARRFVVPYGFGHPGFRRFGYSRFGYRGFRR